MLNQILKNPTNATTHVAPLLQFFVLKLQSGLRGRSGNQKKDSTAGSTYYWGWFCGGGSNLERKTRCLGVHRENPATKTYGWKLVGKKCERSQVFGNISHFSKKEELYLELAPQVEKLLLVVANFRKAHWIPSSSSLPLSPSSSIMSNTMQNENKDDNVNANHKLNHTSNW